MSEKQIQLPLDQEAIKELIPHRDPFLFIDEVTEFSDSEVLVAKRKVTGEEDFFKGHFPGRPIMPGVLVLEAMAQTAVLFFKLSSAGVGPGKLMVFTGVENAKFRRQIVPGDELTFKAGAYKNKLVHWKIHMEAFVGDEKAAEATIKATEIS